jgi:D-amino-acid oxidase
VIDPAITTRIIRQAAALGIRIGTVSAERVGLRPYRLEVRLEREGRIVHNYGHGGAGFTLCRGCAEEVCDVISRA